MSFYHLMCAALRETAFRKMSIVSEQKKLLRNKCKYNANTSSTIPGNNTQVTNVYSHI